MMSVDDISSLFPSTRVHSFPILRNTSFSGILLGPEDINPVYKRTALVECPTCLALDDFYSLEKTSKFDAVFCPGNQPAEHECKDILGNKHTHQIPCAGVLEAHFHVNCNCCGKIFLLSLPNKEK